MTDTTDSSTPISRRSRKLKSGSARAAFQSRDFRRIWFGSFASNIGTWIQNVVLPVYIYLSLELFRKRLMLSCF
ncbi:MAG: hypothetical protein EBV13_04990 [Actinobacteria bacterium]|nr:hypothetical protein [Actinomycetota bacterium]